MKAPSTFVNLGVRSLNSSQKDLVGNSTYWTTVTTARNRRKSLSYLRVYGQHGRGYRRTPTCMTSFPLLLISSTFTHRPTMYALPWSSILNVVALGRRFNYPPYSCTRSPEIRRSKGNLGNDLCRHLQDMTTFGMPPLRYWPWKPEFVGQTPGPQLYAYAKCFSDTGYLKLEGRNPVGSVTLHTIKSFLAANIPIAFGFSVPGFIYQDGTILYYCYSLNASLLGGQAIVAVGYDDQNRAGNRRAMLVRRIWGMGWGEKGWGWLPYAYVE